MEGTIEHEKRDSIELSRNAKGEYAYKAKLYYDNIEEPSKNIIEELASIDEMMQEKFG
jgi:hypothetical protein